MIPLERLGVVDWPVWFIAMAIKVAVLVGLGLIISSVLRKHAPRHSRPLWIVVFTSVVILPAATIIAPAWNIPVLPTADLPVRDAQSADLSRALETNLSESAERATHDSIRVDRNTGTDVQLEADAGAGATLVQEAQRALGVALDRIPTVLLLVWFIGVVLAFTGIIWRLLRNDCHARLAEPVHDVRWHDELDRLCARLGVRRTVRLVSSSAASVPMTCGALRPVVILPRSAPSWDAERVRVVLLHELIHVRRKDWLIEIVGQIGRAMYWFNPLMWIALREWRLVCEESCDALVVANGTRPSSYAQMLMEFAEELRRRNRAWTSSLAMARCHSLEERLMTILRPPVKTRRGFATLPLLSAVMLTTVTAAVVIQPVRQTPEQTADELESIFLKWGEIGTFHGSLSTYDDGFVRFVGDHHEGKLVVQQKLDDDIRFVLRESGEVEYDGGDDETRSMGNDVTTEIVSMGSDARVRMATELDGVEFELEVTPDEDGRPSYEFAVNGEPRRFDDQAREWMDTMFSVAEDIRDIQEIRFEEMNLNGEISQLNHRRSRLQHEIREIQSEEHKLRFKISDIRSERSNSLVKLVNTAVAQTELRTHIRQLRAEDADADVTELEERLAALEERELDIKETLRVEDPVVDERVAAVEQEFLDLNTEQRIAEVEQQIAALETDQRIAGVEACARRVGRMVVLRRRRS